MKRFVVLGQFALFLALPLRGQDEPLTNASQVGGLTAAQAARGLEVKLHVTLTYFNPDWNAIFVQDETGAAFVNLNGVRDPAISNDFQAGQIIELTGKTHAGPVHCDIAAKELRVVGTGAPPEPLDLTVKGHLAVENERLRVKGTGQVFSIGNNGGRPRLHLLTPSGVFLDVSLPNGALAEAESLRGATINFEGVMALDLTQDRRPNGFNVFVTGMDAIQTIKSRPIVPIAQLAANGEPARIRASVEALRPGSLMARDASGVVEVELAEQAAFAPGTTIEVFGYPTQVSNRLVMTRAQASVPVGADPALPVLDTIAKVRELSVKEAGRGYPVQVRGVVTYNEMDADQQLDFVQDGTAGIYVGLSNKRFDVFPEAGSTVELRGFTGPGGFAPIIEAEGLRIIGPGRFPNATPAPSQLLMTGMVDSQWVQLNGVVRSATATSNRTTVTLSTGDAVIQMTVMGTNNTIPSNFVGASIEARGVCRTLFDNRRQLKGIGFCVPNWDALEIKEAEVADPFQLPPGPISGLFEFHAGGYGLNRSHVRGQIILRERSGAFFVQDDSGGVLVQAGGAIPAADWVDVVGFLALKDQLPMLQDALARPATQGALQHSKATRLAPESALDEAFNATLVTLDGRVLTHSFSATEETVTVQFGQRLIDAIMERSDREPLAAFVPGSTVRFTGVYVARLDNNRQIQSFQLLLRSPADVEVISVPPWWTAQHALYVFGGLGGVLFLTLAWVAGLRKQVRRRTKQLRAEIDERIRIEAQMEKTHRELVETSRRAGMAEVATSVLHNVGNVLNSVNVSATLLFDNTKKSSVARLAKGVALLNEHTDGLGDYLAHDPKGKQLPNYISQVSEQLTREQLATLAELESLQLNVEHIKEIVAAQQNYAKISGVAETVKVTDVVEDALRMNEDELARQEVKLVREYTEVSAISVEKHKLLQILVNLIKNAKQALDERGHKDKLMTLSISPMNGNRVAIRVVDNGVGIPAENLERIFAHGFTTRKNGHGFGLHSGALAATELGGSLRAQSPGQGQGACFILELPTHGLEKAR